MNVWLDTETYADIDLKAVGTYRYAEDAEVMLLPYAIDDGDTDCWDVTSGAPMPDDLKCALENPDAVFFFHNALFDRTVLRLGNLNITLPIESTRCTMVQALAHALPGSLDLLGKVLGLPEDQQKLAEGKKLIQLFCKPRPANQKLRRATRETHPAEWQRFVEYAKQDVATMRECHTLMPDWNYRGKELDLWHLDQHINDRGFAADKELVRAGAAAAVREKEVLAKRFAELTDDHCTPSQRAVLQAYLNDRFGLALTSTAKDVMEPLADDEDGDPVLREIAEIVLASNRSSTAKFAKLAQMLSSDGRMRGGLQFDGASRTRRWAGRGFQPQNLPSRGLPKAHETELFIAALKAGAHDLIFDQLMLRGAAALRGVVIAGEKI